MDLVPAESDHLRQIGFQQAVTADDVERRLPPIRGQRHAVIRRVTEQSQGDQHDAHMESDQGEAQEALLIRLN